MTLMNTHALLDPLSLKKLAYAWLLPLGIAIHAPHADAKKEEAARSSSAPVKITFIHFNDLHAHLTPHADLVPDAPIGQTSTRTKVVERGGVARLATMVKRIRSDNPNSIFMNIGDTYHGGVEAFYTNGNAIVDPVNALNIDVGVVGNWDFAYGPLVTRMRYTNLPITKMMRPVQRMAGKMKRGGLRERFNRNQESDEASGESELMMPLGEIKRPNFPNLAANVTMTMPPMRRGQLLMPATMVKDMNGVKVGLIGLTSDIVPRMHKMLAFGMSFVEGEDNYRDLVNRYQKKLRAEGADVVVVMSELGLQKNYRLAQVIDPGVDVIFSAHTHEAIFKPLTSRSGALVVEAGNDGNLGRMDVVVKNRKVVDRQWQLTPIDNTIPEDPEIKRLVDQARAPFLAANVNMSVPMPMLHQKLTQPIDTVAGHTNVLLDRRNVLENSFNDLMGDIMRRTSGTDVAITPGFRFDSVVPARGMRTETMSAQRPFASTSRGMREGQGIPVEDNTVATGNITLEDVYRFFPVPYNIATADISGERLRAVMEQALTNVFSTDVFLQSGGWLEGFSGLDTTVNLANRDGHRITALRLSQTGKPVTADDKLSVTGCTRLMDAPDSLCSYSGFSNVKPLINKATGQPWTPVDIFVNGLSGDTQSHVQTRALQTSRSTHIKDQNATPFWPRTPFIQPLKGGGGTQQ